MKKFILYILSVMIAGNIIYFLLAYFIGIVDIIYKLDTFEDWEPLILFQLAMIALGVVLTMSLSDKNERN